MVNKEQLTPLQKGEDIWICYRCGIIAPLASEQPPLHLCPMSNSTNSRIIPFENSTAEFIDSKLVRQRISICQACDHGDGPWGYCKLAPCGQEFAQKRHTISGICVLNKWPPLSGSLAPVKQPATFVYPYLASQAVGNELLYSVRSIETHYLGEADIWIVGDRPGWWLRDDRFIDCPQVRGGARIDRAHKLQAIVDCREIPDTFIWMQDDIYFIQPISFAFLATPWTRGPAMTIGRLEGIGRQKDFQAQKCATWLALHGADKSLDDYAAHAPRVYEKEKVSVLIAKYDLFHAQLVDDLLYMNEYAEPGRPPLPIGGRECRITRKTTPNALAARLRPAILLNHAHGQYRGPVELYLEHTFTQRSKWEDPNVVITTTETAELAESTIIPLGTDRLPKIAVCCATYGRPHVVSTMVGCFVRQDYPADRCEMVILDDGGQLLPGTFHFNGKEVRVHVQTERFRTIGHKRNAMRQLISDDVDAITQWDDDDLMMPWALTAMADRLQQVGIALCSWGFWQEKNGTITTIRKIFHSACAIPVNVFDAVGGYAAQNRAEDMRLLSWWIDKHGHGHFPAERNTMDNYHPYILVRRYLSGTHHASNKGFRLEDAIRQSGEQVAIGANPLPEEFAGWYAARLAEGFDQRKLIADSQNLKGTYTPRSDTAEWHLTYACDLACIGCNRLCFMPPRTPRMELSHAEEFIRQAEAMNWHPRIFILGGEPCLHPDLLRFIEIAHRLSPGRIVVWSNGYSEQTQAALDAVQQQGLATIKTSTQKRTGSKIHKFADMFLAPSDFGITARDPCNCHAACGQCGISVDAVGYTLCPSGGAIDATLNLGLRTKRLADLFDPAFAKNQTVQMCRVCGFRLGYDPTRIAASQVIHGVLMSPTWQAAIGAA